MCLGSRRLSSPSLCFVLPLVLLFSAEALLPRAVQAQGDTPENILALHQVLDDLLEICETAIQEIPDEPTGEEDTWWSGTCEKKDSDSIDVEVCRAELTKLWRGQFDKAQDQVLGKVRQEGLTLLREASQPPTLAPDLSRTLRRIQTEVRRTLQREIDGLSLSSYELDAASKPESQKKAQAAWGTIATGMRGEAQDTCEIVVNAGLDTIEDTLFTEQLAKKARINTAAALKSAEEDLFAELSGKKQDGFAQVVKCEWTPGEGQSPPTLVCSSGVLLGGEEPAVIEITGLDPGRTHTITARSAEEVVARTGVGHVPSLGLSSRDVEAQCPEDRTTPLRERLSCDQLELPPGSDAAFIAIHLPRRFDPSFEGPFFRSLKYARQTLRRPGPREKLSLVLFGRTPVVQVQVHDGSRATSSFVPSAYQRWTFETGGFFAVSNVVDHELVTEQVPATDGHPAMTRVVRIANEDDQAQDTGIFLNFVPRNYQVVGAGLGFAVESDRAPTTYVGLTIRLRSFGERGLAALWGGFVFREAQRFPGVAEGDELGMNDPRLQGEERFEEDWFLGVQLGFSFGPIQGGD